MKRHLQSALARVEQRAKSEHLSPDVLSAWTEGALSGREKKNALDHLSMCSDCRECIALIAEPPQPVRRRSQLWMAGVAAAGVAVLLLFAWQWKRPYSAPKPPFTQAQKLALAQRLAGTRQDIPSPVEWRIVSKNSKPSPEYSTDAGKSWKTTPLPNIRMHSVAWTGQTAWVFGEGGKIVVSNDNGKHWDAVSSAHGPQVQDADAHTEHDFGVSTKRLDVITTAGKHWAREEGVWRELKK